MRECEPDLGAFEQLARQAYVERIPINATLELTRRCNMRCVHCYAGPGYRAPGEGPEMSAGEWRGVINQLVDAGCLMLLMTGGEPLLRPDLSEIYLYAREKGLVVTLFTNATLVTEETARFLKSMPPRGVDVTLYGATAETYERITRTPGSFEKCMRGIKILLDAGVRVTLKSVLMTLNEHEFEEIENLCMSLVGKFRIDPIITPGYGGDLKPIKYRVTPEIAAHCDFALEKRRDSWRKIFERPDEKCPDRLFSCAAGMRACHISSNGELYACLVDADAPGYDLRKRSFADGWEKDILERVSQPVPEGFQCLDCSIRKWCIACPFFAGIDARTQNGSKGWMCQLAELRKGMTLEIIRSA